MANNKLPTRESKNPPKLVKHPDLEKISKLYSSRSLREKLKVNCVTRHVVESFDITRNKCPRDLVGKEAELNGWLLDSLVKGCFSEYIDGSFPKKIWYKDEKGRFFEAIHEGNNSGNYHGCELSSLPEPYKKEISNRLRSR